MREKQLAQEAKKLDAKTPSQRNKWQQQELIAELRRRQAKEHRPVYEGKDGTIEDIITGGTFVHWAQFPEPDLTAFGPSF